MAKKITITLSDKAEKYFNEVMYALTGEDDKPCTQSQAINETLETMYDFEKLEDNQLRGWLDDKYPNRPKDTKGTWYEHFKPIDHEKEINPSQEEGR